MTGNNDIRGLLEIATADEPPPEAGPARVFTLARTIQRRRRLGVGLVGVSIVGVLVAGAALASSLGGGPAVQTGVDAPAPSATSPTDVRPEVAVGADQVLETLRELLPPDVSISSPMADSGFARLVIADAGGQTTVEVNIQPDFVAGAGKTDDSPLLDRYDCAKRTDPAGTACTATTLPDKTRVVSTAGPSDEPGAAGVIRRQVDTVAPDGTRIVVTVWNAVDLRKGSPTRTTPALDGRQLQEIATSDRWRTDTPNAGGANG